MPHGVSLLYGADQPADPAGASADEDFLSGSQTAVIDAVVADVAAGCSVIAVRGGPGVGKTTVLHKLAQVLRGALSEPVILREGAQSPGCVQRALRQAGYAPPALYEAASGVPRPTPPAGKRAAIVLLLDNADIVPVDTYRYLNRLILVEPSDAAPVQAVLVGKSGIWPSMQYPDLAALRTASASCHMLLPLRPEEAMAYVDYELGRTGLASQHVMTPMAKRELCAQAKQNPAAINLLLSRAIAFADVTGSRRITRGRLRTALTDQPPPGAPFLAPYHAPLPALGAAGLVIIAGVAGIAALVHGVAPHPSSSARSDSDVKAGSTVTVADTFNGEAPADEADWNRPDKPSATATGRSPLPPAPAAVVRPPMMAESVPRPAPPPPTWQPSHRNSLPGHTASAAITGPITAAAPPQPRPPVPGLVLVARPGDTIAKLYAQIYRHVTPPPYAVMLAANPSGIRAGSLVVFPEPPLGWGGHSLPRG
jgi:MSHA biogenesis protein MshM